MSLHDHPDALPRRAPIAGEMGQLIDFDKYRQPLTEPDTELSFDNDLEEMFERLKNEGPQPRLHSVPTFEEIDEMLSKVSGRGTAAEEGSQRAHTSLFNREGDVSSNLANSEADQPDPRLAGVLSRVQEMLHEETRAMIEVDTTEVDVVEFTVPKKTGRIRNWIQSKSVQATNVISGVFEKAKEHPVAALAVVVGGLAITSYAGYKFGISKGGGSSNTGSVDRATEWYEMYRQNNPGVSREQFNQIITSEEFRIMCENPVEFARFATTGA